jgi:high-affinity iron transporter
MKTTDRTPVATRRRLVGRLVAAAVLALLVVPSNPARAAEETFESLSARLDEARRIYPAEPQRAREVAGDAFLAFESSGLDRTIAARDPGAYKALEADWMKMVSRMRSGAPATEIDALHGSILGRLGVASAPAGTAAAGRGALFANSLLIILREGFEAILILSAVAASLRASGNAAALRPFYGGALAAIAASLALAVVAHRSGGFGASREAIEGLTCLLAVVVLFFTSYWLISRVEGRRWQQFIRDSVKRAASSDRLGGLAALAFLVVFREGFETVLFYQALVVESGGTAAGLAAVAGGLVAGLVLLALLYAAIRWFGVHVPMRSFFAVTGGLLYLLAIKFAGVGIRELQEAGWLAQHPVSWVPDAAFLRDWLGVFPDALALALQGLLVLALVGGWLWSRGSGEPRVEAAAARHAA